MICKNCGATVKDRQITCTSCGTYLSKDNTTESASLGERASMSGGSDLYAHKIPVTVNDGWKWYTFITWGIVPLFALSAILEIPSYFKISFLLGLLAIVYVVLGYFTHLSLREFEEKSRIMLYIFLAMPILMLFMSCYGVLDVMRETYGTKLSIGVMDVIKQPKMTLALIRYVAILIINIIYFNNRKDEFQF